jgi:hypothetical protein
MVQLVDFLQTSFAGNFVKYVSTSHIDIWDGQNREYWGLLRALRYSTSSSFAQRILARNRTYFAAISLFRNRLLSRATKILLYKTLIRPVVTYGAEIWGLTKKEK